MPDSWSLSDSPFLELHPKTELHHAGLILDVEDPLRLAVRRAGLVRHVSPVVLVVEHVEHLGDGIDAQPTQERNLLLDPKVDPVYRIADEVVARHDRAVRAQAWVHHAARVAKVAAVRRRVAVP